MKPFPAFFSYKILLIMNETKRANFPPATSVIIQEDKKNIVKRLDHFVFRKHLILTFELLSVNLYDFIKMNNFLGFSLSLIKRFAI